MSAGDALALVAAMVVEADGTTWAQQADESQWADMERILDPDGPRLGWAVRPRGYGKTRDLAAALLARSVVDLAEGSQSHGFAVDLEQAKLLHHSIRSIVERTAFLRSAVRLTNLEAEVPSRGTRITVMPADGPGSHGLRSEHLVVDEIGVWPDVQRSHDVWEAVLSTVQKSPTCRLTAISTPSHPDAWSMKFWERANESPNWWTSHTLGPPSWQSPEMIEELRHSLPDGAFKRLILGEFAAGADQTLATEDQIERMFRPLDAPEPRIRGHHSYVAGLDLSVTGDQSAVAVAHLEHAASGDQIVVVDRLLVWKPTKSAPLSQDRVLAELLNLTEEFPGLKVNADPYQSLGLLERLRRHGIQTEVFTFSPSSKTRVAAMDLSLVREDRLSLPPDPDLLADVRAAQVKERPDGSFFVEVPRSNRGHGDTLTAVELAAWHLLQGQPRLARLGGGFWGGASPSGDQADRFLTVDPGGERAYVQAALDRMHAGGGDRRLRGRR